MNHHLTIKLIWVFYYFAIAVWTLLALLLLIGVLRKKWNSVKRLSKYLINSLVFVVVYIFYFELAMILRPRTDKEHLQGWVNEYVSNDIHISIVAILILFGLNLFFYKIVEKHKHKIDLIVLTVFDIAILICGALLSGQDAYLGLLEEINRG